MVTQKRKKNSFSFFFSRCNILYLSLYIYIYTNFSLFNASCLEDCDFYLVFIPTSGKHTRTYDIYAEITMFRARCNGLLVQKNLSSRPLNRRISKRRIIVPLRAVSVSTVSNIRLAALSNGGQIRNCSFSKLITAP